MYMHMHGCMYMYMCMYMHGRMYVYMCMYMQMCVFLYVYMRFACVPADVDVDLAVDPYGYVYSRNM